MGNPGCPDFAFSTASTAKKRIELMHSSWSDWVATTIIFLAINYDKTTMSIEFKTY